jgi:hypothetical protein
MCVRGGCGWRILRDHLGVGCVGMYVGIRRCDVYGSCDTVGSIYVFQSVSLFHLTACGIVCVYVLELSTSAVVVDPLFSTILHPLL